VSKTSKIINNNRRIFFYLNKTPKPTQQIKEQYIVAVLHTKKGNHITLLHTMREQEGSKKKYICQNNSMMPQAILLQLQTKASDCVHKVKKVSSQSK
jgi:hypothetical protein